ncbi:MAG: protein-disulfide reductase DsbD family protein [Methylocystis sp.]|nr:protein-disulfide reductase DsbD family protein [Methylocystis sp.]
MTRGRTTLSSLIAATLVASGANWARAQEFASAASRGSISAARLLSADAPQSGDYRAGVEIALDPKVITYWRQPGEAGSPPVFDFSKSENISKVDVGYPAPKHIDDAGTIVAGYDARVIFPLKVTPADAGKPVTLRLKLDYAACGKICLPARADVALTLPQTGSSPFASDIADAEKKVPARLTADEAKKRFSTTRAGDGVWRLRYKGAGKAEDVFAEVKEPLFIESKKIGDDFELTLFSTGEKPKGADATLTIVTDKGAFEAPARLE